jgi:hypothetical protein
VGHLKVSHYSILWNGCVEEYPIKDQLPYKYCRDDDHGGYGDGFGTATLTSPAPGWQVHFDQGVVAYNTQDGLDALHIAGAGSSMTVTHTLAYGNMGNQIKVGGAATVVTDNTIIGNCGAMKNNIPGTPPGFNHDLDDYCRAGDVAAVIEVFPEKAAVYERNTLYTNGSIGLEVEYSGEPSPQSVVKYDHNVFVGFRNGEGQYPSPVYGNSGLEMFRHTGSSFDGNITYRFRGSWHCPSTEAHETNGSCNDPHLPDETWPEYGYPKIGAPGNHMQSRQERPSEKGAGHSSSISAGALIGAAGVLAASGAAIVYFRNGGRS